MRNLNINNINININFSNRKGSLAQQQSSIDSAKKYKKYTTSFKDIAEVKSNPEATSPPPKSGKLTSKQDILKMIKDDRLGGRMHKTHAYKRGDSNGSKAGYLLKKNNSDSGSPVLSKMDFFSKKGQDGFDNFDILKQTPEKIGSRVNVRKGDKDILRKKTSLDSGDATNSLNLRFLNHSSERMNKFYKSLDKHPLF